MAKLNLIKKGTTNAIQTTLNGSLSSSATSITLNAVTGLQNTTGLGVIDRVDSSGTLTPSKREYVYWTSISGSALTLPNTSDGRGAAGSTAQSHADGAIFEEILGVDEWNGLITSYSAQHNDAGTHSAITATSISATSLATTSFPGGITAGMLNSGAILVANTIFTNGGSNYNSGDGSTEKVIPGLSTPVTFPPGSLPGRSVRATFSGDLFNSVDGGVIVVRIKSGASVYAVGESTYAAAANTNNRMTLPVIIPGSAASAATYSVTFQNGSVGGNSSLQFGQTGEQSSLTVELL